MTYEEQIKSRAKRNTLFTLGYSVMHAFLKQNGTPLSTIYATLAAAQAEGAPSNALYHSFADNQWITIANTQKNGLTQNDVVSIYSSAASLCAKIARATEAA